MKVSLSLEKPTIYNYQFIFQNYGIFEYEKELALLEIKSLIGQKPLTNGKLTELNLNREISKTLIDKFTFFNRIILRQNDVEEIIKPKQIYYENSAKIIADSNKLVNSINITKLEELNGRKESKYGSHGIHDYKGKFYPQLAKSLINIFAKDKSTILDPFCGSGTSVFEATLLGYTSIGLDLNPLAAMIASVKLNSLRWNKDEFYYLVSDIIKKLDEYDSKINYTLTYKGELEYLQHWFSPKILNKLFFIYNEIQNIDIENYKRYLLIIFSNILRECSHQDPRQLRIFKRKVRLLDFNVIETYKKNLVKESNKIISFLCVNNPSSKRINSLILNEDSRQLIYKKGIFGNGIDLVITSPPYATALPYIDTDRLSLHFLGLIKKGERKKLEFSMIGNREITDSIRKKSEEEMKRNDFDLPEEVYSLIMNLYKNNSISNVGFRRRNLPCLLYSYFKDMKTVMSNIYDIMNNEAYFIIVIGNNFTISNVRKIQITTDRFLEEIGEQIGYIRHDPIKITVTAENLIHIKNFIKENKILVLQKL